MVYFGSFHEFAILNDLENISFDVKHLHISKNSILLEHTLNRVILA